MGRRPLCWTGRAVGVNSYDLRMADRRPPIQLRSRDPGHWPRLCRVADRYAAELTPPRPAGPDAVRCAGDPYCWATAGAPVRQAPGRSAGHAGRVVVPIAYAVKGGRHATSLWRYKSGGPAAAAARASLRALALVFLRDHGACIWRQAAMPPPRWLALPPSGQGRPGVARWPGCCGRPWPAPGAADPAAEASTWAGRSTRGSSGPGARLAGASVLLIDDTWASGASAQSAAVALRVAGARHVAVMVLGRHIDPADARSRPLCSGPASMRYDPRRCAVHPVITISNQNCV